MKVSDKPVEFLKWIVGNQISQAGVKFYRNGQKGHCRVVIQPNRVRDVIEAHVAGCEAPGAMVISSKSEGEPKPLRGPFVLCAFLENGNQTSKLVVDIDGGSDHEHPCADPKTASERIASALSDAGLKPYICLSPGGAGFHVWVFLDEPIDKVTAREAIISAIPTDIQLRSGSFADARKDAGIEVYPKRGAGNTIALPLGGACKGRGGKFVEGHDPLVGDTWEIIRSPSKTLLTLFNSQPRDRETRREQSTEPRVKIEIRYEAILKACHATQYLHENRQTLTEPDWDLHLRIARFTANGEEICHRISKDYLGYDADETDDKIQRINDQTAPVTCKKIEDRLGKCSGCVYLGKFRNPVEVAQYARIEPDLTALDSKVTADKSTHHILYEPQALRILSKIKKMSRAIYEKFLTEKKVAKTKFEEALLEFVKAESFAESKNQSDDYYETNSGIFMRGFDGDKQLTNFTSWITAENITNDGFNTFKVFRIEGRVESAGQNYSITVPNDQFQLMNWPITEIGPFAMVMTGPTAKDHAQQAIRVLSKVPPREMTFAHTGFVQLDGELAFLHRGGAITRNGNKASVRVDLRSDTFNSYLLPSEPTPKQIESGFRDVIASMSIVVKPLGSVLPLIALRAPLQHFNLLPASIFFEGRTGSYKSTTAGHVLSFFGAEFNHVRLTDSFSSTANALEKTLGITADVLCVIDEFVATTESGSTSMQAKADRLIRAIGNRNSRGRMRSDLSTQISYVPKCLCVMTGERLPSGQSLLARLIIFPFDEASVDTKALFPLCTPESRTNRNALMADYIKWICENDSIANLISTSEAEIGSRVQLSGGHARIGPNISGLGIAGPIFLRYAKDRGLADAAECSTVLDRWIVGLKALEAEQKRFVMHEDPLSDFFARLGEILASGKAEISVMEVDKGVTRIGFENETEVCLFPDITMKVVVEMAPRTEMAFPYNHRTLARRMIEEGYIFTDGDHNSVKRVDPRGAGRNQVRVWAFTKQKFDQLVYQRGSIEPDEF